MSENEIQQILLNLTCNQKLAIKKCTIQGCINLAKNITIYNA